MARPHPLLLELAAGREPVWDGREGAALVRSAREHRITGLLWTRAADVGVDQDPEAWDALSADDVRNWARREVLRHGLGEVLARLGAAGIEVAIVKGFPAEDRWYQRPGERPFQDLDVWLAPSQARAVDRVVGILQPDHFLVGSAQTLVDGGHISEVDLWVEGVPVDFHVDLFGLGLHVRRPEAIWERTEERVLRDGLRVRTLDAEMSLINFVLHLNRDSFRRLLGYVDVARILRSEELDWTFIGSFVGGEGLEALFYPSLWAVVEDLGLKDAGHRRMAGTRVWWHRRLWGPEQRLLGELAWVNWKRRQFWQPFLISGRLGEAISWWGRRILPPKRLVAYYSLLAGRPEAPYVQAVVLDRLRGLGHRRRPAHSPNDR